jgi:Predicted double-stranded RNA/RNA-DNA hybrid binding protein
LKVGILVAQKFYAVRRGRRPGIYRTWPETQQQVNGFTGAQYKSFPTEAAAKAFMQGQKHDGRPAASPVVRPGPTDDSGDHHRLYGWGLPQHG